MAYIINDTRGQIVAVIEDGTIDTTSTDLQLVGRGVTDYGTAENENLVWLLENFADDTAPLTPIVGQLWYNTSDGGLYVRTLTNTWEAFVTEAYVDAQKISPAFTGIPTAPTASSTNSSTQLATTAFVQAQKASPSFTGVPTAPTAPSGNSTTQIATTAFVQSAIGDINLTQYAPINNPTFTGTPFAPGPGIDSDNLQIATTGFVQSQKVSPVFTGIPRAPTAASSTANTQIATTAFVTNAVSNVDLSVYAPKASPTFTGTPLAPTAGAGTNTTQLATTAFVTNAVSNVNLSVYAPKASPTFTGTPLAPTASVGTNTTQLATTAFVQTQLASLGAGDATLGTVQTFTALKYFAGGIVAGSASAPNNASYNFYDGIGTTTDTSIYYSSSGGTLNVSLQGNIITTIYPTYVAFNQQVRVPSTGIRFSDGTVQTTATASGPAYTLPTASTSTLGGVKVDGTTITVTGGGVITSTATNYTLPIASSSVLGGFKVGTGLTISAGGTLSTTGVAPGPAYTLPTASTSTLGGVKVDGTTITINGSGVITSTATNYTLPIASSSVLGGFKVGSGLSITAGGTLSATGGGGTPTNPAGANTQVQFNNDGSFGATSNLTYDSATKLLQVNGGRFGTITDGSFVVAYVIGDSYAGIGIQTPRSVGVVLENNALRPTQLYVDSGSQAWNWRNLYVSDNFVWNGKTIPAPGTSTTLFLRNDGTWATPATGGAAYTLPTASTSTLGGVKVDGTTVTINGSGVITANVQTAQGYLITKGTTQAYGFTNSFEFDNSANYFDVFPPAGYTMSQYAGGIVSIAYIYFAGAVDGNDALRCIADLLPDRFRVYVQNTEQRALPSANWIAFWTNV